MEKLGDHVEKGNKLRDEWRQREGKMGRVGGGIER